MAVEIPALGSTPSSHRRLTLLFATTLAEARQLMKCGNTCGRGDYGLSEIQLHKLMIKSLSLRRGHFALGAVFGPEEEEQTETTDV